MPGFKSRNEVREQGNKQDQRNRIRTPTPKESRNKLKKKDSQDMVMVSGWTWAIHQTESKNPKASTGDHLQFRLPESALYFSALRRRAPLVVTVCACVVAELAADPVQRLS